MMASTGKTAQQLLDEVQSLTQLERFRVEAFLDQLRGEIAGGDVATLEALEERDQRMRGVLAAIDAFASKCMRIRLAHVLATDTSLGPPFRTYLASTVTSHDGDLDLLRQRVIAAAARADPAGASNTATSVVDAARHVLAARSELREALFTLTRELAAVSIPVAQRAARDPSSSDVIRLRWTAARRDLELLADRPERLAEASFADRRKALPPIEEAPEQALVLTRGELLELD